MINLDSKTSREKYVKFVIGQTYFLAGCGYAFSALLIPKLSDDSILPDEAIAWIASSGILLRSFVGGLSLYLINSSGRSGTIRLKTWLITLGWILTSASSDIGLFCTGRIITSLGLGFIADNIAYISETCTTHHVSNLVSLATSYTTAGIIFSNLLQYYFTWRTSAFIIAVVSSVVLLQAHTILITSSVIMILAVGVANVYRTAFHDDAKSYSWILVTSWFVYTTANVAFFDPTISIVLSELFPKTLEQYISILRYAIEYKLSLAYIFAFPGAIVKYGIDFFLWFFFVNSMLCFIVTVHFTSSGNIPRQYECVTFFEGEAHLKEVDQRELLQAMIEEDNSK